MSKFIALKSAGLGNRIKIYVSYLQRYDEVLIEKEPDLELFENFKLCNKEEDNCLMQRLLFFLVPDPLRPQAHTDSLPNE